MWALANNHTAISRWIVYQCSNTLDIDCTSGGNWTVIHWAAIHCTDRDIVTRLLLLCTSSDTINMRDSGGRTALDMAVGFNNIVAVECLGGTLRAAWDRRSLERIAREELGGKKLEDMLSILQRIDQERQGGAAAEEKRKLEERRKQLEEKENKEKEEREQVENEEKRKRQEQEALRQKEKEEMLKREKLEKERQRKEEERLQKLQEQQLREQKLQEQKLREQKLREQKLREQKLQEQKLREQKLREQKLQEQKLREQKLIEQKLREQKLQEQKLREQKLQEQQLREKEARIQKENKKLHVDEKRVAAWCKSVREMSGDQASQYLEHNPDLLNCLNGEPIRQAALGSNEPVIEVLMKYKDLNINLRDHNDRTALHHGTSTDDQQIVKMLLKHTDIEVNPISKRGRTPLMEATTNGKIESLEVLLEDERVDLNIDDEDGQTLEDKLSKELAPHLKARARWLFKEARTYRKIKNRTIIRKKTAILAINTDYTKTKEWISLQGPLEDLNFARRIFEAKDYKVFEIRNSLDICEDVANLIEEEKISDSDVLQFFFSGHGIHKTTAEKCDIIVGSTTFEETTTTTYRQEGELGDCLVHSDGSLCEELLLSLQISSTLKEDASMCFFYDMCRSEDKDKSQIHMKEEVKINLLDYKQGVQKSGADRRMVKIFSSQLGEKSSGLGSFFQRICQEIEASSPRGIKLVDMQNLEKSSQRCQIELGGPGWDNKWWPLE